MFRSLLLAFGMVAFLAVPAYAQGDGPGGEGCVDCNEYRGEDIHCEATEDGANECDPFEMCGPFGEECWEECGLDGGACGFDAVSLSGDVVLTAAQAEELLSTELLVRDKLDPEVLRRSCDLALVSVASSTPVGDRLGTIQIQ